MADTLHDQLRQVELAIQAGKTDEARRLLARTRQLAQGLLADNSTLRGDVDRYQVLMERTLDVTLARGLEPVAERILEGMMAIVMARRGFVGLVDGAGWKFLVARNLTQESIARPEGQVSGGIITQVIASGEPVVTHDAGQEFSGQHSVAALRLRSVACFPLRGDQGLLGFVYLDDAETRGLFDEAAVAALRSWLPVVAGAIAKAAATDREDSGLPGVVTRSSRMRSALSELGRIARFEVPVLLTGETGTGKSLIARKLHDASPRARKPFVHVNCGAIPEALLEGELFGSEAGAYTGSKGRREGRFEAAEGGTLFLDELDTMPLSCQVKLLVALQEREITRLGSNQSIKVNVRVIAAMGADPFEAIDAGRLREDLYYRIGVFVSQILPLRERPEDLPLLATHFLEQTRARYSLPPLRLGPAALDTLTAHRWPGNVRELANTLDRAALLAEGGVIRDIQLTTRKAATAPTSAGGTLAQLELAAKRLVEAMGTRPDLRTLDTADVMRSLVLLEAVGREGSRDAGFCWLGQASLVQNRNHFRALKREVDRVRALAEALGEGPGERLSGLLEG